MEMLSGIIHGRQVVIGTADSSFAKNVFDNGGIVFLQKMHYSVFDMEEEAYQINRFGCGENPFASFDVAVKYYRTQLNHDFRSVEYYYLIKK